MIVYRPYKLPTGKLNLDGRMRKVRRSDGKHIRLFSNWFKRRKRW